MAKIKGIDVSHWQGTIDWNKVKAAGIKFAIIKAGGLFNPTTGSTTHTVWKNGVTTSALAPTANQIIIRLANSSK